MKASVNLAAGVIEVEGENPQELFEEIAAATEVFNETACGECKSENIRPVVRNVGQGKQSFKYFEWQCQACRAYVALGQQEGGRLFPKRKLKDNGEPCKPGEEGRFRNNGWTKFRGNPEQPAEAATEPAQARPARR